MRNREPFINGLAAFIACAACAAIFVDEAGAGAWPRKKSSYYLKTSVSYLFATDEYDHNGDQVDIFSNLLLVDNTSFQDVTINAYLEYGLTDHLTLVGSLPFSVLSSERRELADENTPVRRLELINGGLTDLRIGLRYPLIQERVVVALQEDTKIPLFYDPSPDNEGPPLGSAKVDIDVRLLVGVSMWPFPGYLGAEVGYRFRGGNLDDEILFGLEGGATAGRLFAKLAFDGLLSTVSPRDLGMPGEDGTTVLVANQDILKINPALGYTLTAGLMVTGEVFHVVSGKNTVKGTSYSLGLVFER